MGQPGFLLEDNGIAGAGGSAGGGPGNAAIPPAVFSPGAGRPGSFPGGGGSGAIALSGNFAGGVGASGLVVVTAYGTA